MWAFSILSFQNAHSLYSKSKNLLRPTPKTTNENLKEISKVKTKGE